MAGTLLVERIPRRSRLDPPAVRVGAVYVGSESQQEATSRAGVEIDKGSKETRDSGRHRRSDSPQSGKGPQDGVEQT